MQKIKQGDEVIVISGKDKGKTGVISKLDGCKVLIEGINTGKKHVKANPNANERGGIVVKSFPIQRSNVMVYDSASKKGSKVGIRTLEDGSKVRYFKSTNEVVDV